jgi:predicted TIM-barrel fold metal-dependent hydrolase
MTDFRIFDVHQHIGSLEAGGASGPVATSYDEDYARRSAALDQFGFTAAIAMPSLQYPRPRGFVDTQALNDAIAAYRDRYGARFPVALGTVQPTDPAEMSVGEIERMANVLKLDGVVWHHRLQSVFLGDRRMHPLLDACAKHKMVAFIHVIADSNMEAPWLLEELYEAHPDVTFVALDPLTGFTQIRFIMQMAKRCPNLLFDTAINMPLGRSIEEFVDKFGSERLLFGTDMYLGPTMYVYPHVLREILDAPTLTDDDRRNIFWDNAARLFPRAFSKLKAEAR